jgi:hypothetical protein
MDFQLAQQVRLSRALEYLDGGAGGTVDIRLPQGASGVVIDLGDDLNAIVTVKFDQPHACLEEWDNCVAFDLDADGDKGIGVASDFLVLTDQDDVKA